MGVAKNGRPRPFSSSTAAVGCSTSDELCRLREACSSFVDALAGLGAAGAGYGLRSRTFRMYSFQSMGWIESNGFVDRNRMQSVECRAHRGVQVWAGLPAPTPTPSKAAQTKAKHLYVVVRFVLFDFVVVVLKERG